MAGVIDPFASPLKPVRIGLGNEGAGLASPSTDINTVNHIDNNISWNMINRFTVVVKTTDNKLLVSSFNDGARDCFGLPIFSIVHGDNVTDPESLLRAVRQKFRLATGLLIDLNPGNDSEMMVTIKAPYRIPAFSATVMIVVSAIDGAPDDLCNKVPTERPFLDFVSMMDFADDVRFPKSNALKQYDVDRIYTIGTHSQYPECTFTRARTTATAVAGASKGYHIPNPRAPSMPIFHGFKDKRTPATFVFDDFCSQSDKLMSKLTDGEKYITFSMCFHDDAYLLVKGYEEVYPETARTFSSFKKYLEPFVPKANDIDNARSMLKKLEMGAFTEAAFLEFLRDFNVCVSRIGGYSDAQQRETFMSKLNNGLKKTVINDTRCPVDPTLNHAIDPIDPNGVQLFTFDRLVVLTREAVSRRSSLNLHTGDSGKAPARDSSPGRKSGKRRRREENLKRKRARGNSANGASANSAFSRAERIKAVADTTKYPNGEGKNKKFTDGTPRTCNNCNSPDHLAHDSACKKKPQGNSASRNSVTAIADSNLSKKMKSALTKMLTVQKNSMNANSDTATPADSGNDQPAANSAVLSRDRLNQLLGQ